MVVSVVPYDKAFDIVSNLIAQMPGSSILKPLTEVQKEILAAPVRAPLSLPPFARAMMDGFAVASQDVAKSPTRLEIVDTISAGSFSRMRLQSGQAMRIATGAPLPDGADAVARLEWCQLANISDTAGGAGAESSWVTVLRPVEFGHSVQWPGEDGREGDELLPAGAVLYPEQMAMLKGFGVHQVEVVQPAVVQVIVTGDEVVPLSRKALKLGQIYSVNDSFLTSLLEEDGWIVQEPVFARDDPEELEQAIVTAAETSDFVITTGGVSVGHRDYMTRVLENLGANIVLQKVMMRPGSPLVAAQLGKTVVFSLSGNPAAAFVQFESLIRPALRCQMGRSDRPFPETARLQHAVSLKPIKPVRIFRARASVKDGVIVLDTALAQSSGVISSLGQANCLVRLDESENPAGTVVPIRWFRHSQ